MHSLLLRDKLSLNKSLFYSFSHVVVFFTEKVNQYIWSRIVLYSGYKMLIE